MVTFIEVLTGADEGLKFKAEAGIQIGRSKGHVILNDSKISGLHAEVQIDARGQLVLIDLDSSNGLIINGRNVKRIALLPGVVFELGRTQLKVFQMEELDAEAYGAVITWRTTLREELPKLEGHNVLPPNPPEPFVAALRLNFIQGVQADQAIVLGYGPRWAGSLSMDVELLDEEAPEKAFVIEPGPGVAFIKSLAPTRVYLNQKLFDKEPLNDGDQVSFGNTIILVSYL